MATTAINQTAGPRQWSQFADLTAAGYWVRSQLGLSNKLINCNLVSLKVYPIKPKFAIFKSLQMSLFLVYSVGLTEFPFMHNLVGL